MLNCRNPIFPCILLSIVNYMVSVNLCVQAFTTTCFTSFGLKLLDGVVALLYLESSTEEQTLVSVSVFSHAVFDFTST